MGSGRRRGVGVGSLDISETRLVDPITKLYPVCLAKMTAKDLMEEAVMRADWVSRSRGCFLVLPDRH